MKKFKEGLDTAVITTRYVLDESSPILFVYHFEDGFWQFSGIEDDFPPLLASAPENINLRGSFTQCQQITHHFI